MRRCRFESPCDPMTIAHRAGVEFRVAGRTLSGVAMRYGGTSPTFRERFMPGAFGEVGTVDINVQHDPALVAVRGALLTDTARELRVRADLPEGSAALALVRRGALNGFSVEFKPKSERREAGIRVVERATLTGLALVDQGAYPAATAEVRARGDRGGRLGTMRGRVPVDQEVECRCSPGDCTSALFEVGSLDGAVDKKEVLAITDKFSDVIASKRREGVRFWRAKDGSLEYAIDIPKTERGQALLDTLKVAEVFGRPVLDRELSDVVVDGAVARYQRAEIRAILLNPTDAAKGWEPVKMTTAEKAKALSKIGRRRSGLWP